MGENDCASLGCSGFSMSQCAQCRQRYCQRHKALLAHLCSACQAAEQRSAPTLMRAGVLLMVLPAGLVIVLAAWLHVNTLGAAPLSMTGLAIFAGVVGSFVVGLVLFCSGWLGRR